MPEIPRILVVDDEEKILRMISDYLEAVGFQTQSASDGKAALSLIETFDPDLMVLDVMMPGLDGFDVIRRIRNSSNLPIILLTARAAEHDKLIGLEIGADDYLTKPFSMKELAARIRAVLRRSAAGPQREQEQKNVLVIGDLELDRSKRSVIRNARHVELTSVQFDILARMMENPGRVFTRMDLLESLQDHAFEGYERTIDVHIKNIRKAIENEPSKPQFIRTVWGIGYKMSEPEEME